MKRVVFLFGLACLAAFFSPSTMYAAEFASTFANTHDRIWIEPEYWANPMEDWRIQNGRLECTSDGGDRNVQLLTNQLGKKSGSFTMSVQLRLIDKGPKGAAGFRIGIQDEIDDYRARLIYGKGLNAGVNLAGALFLGDKQQAKAVSPKDLDKGIELKLDGTPEQNGNTYTLRLTALDAASGKKLATVENKVPASQLYGNIALCNNPLGQSKGQFQGSRFWFKDWKVSGDKVEDHPSRAFGPILWSMHTLSRGVLKMTAQMPPIGKKDSPTVRLEYKKGKEWIKAGEEKIDPLSRTATFRVAKWDDKNNLPYRLVYNVVKKDGKSQDVYYEGTVRKDPVDKKTIVVAGFTGNADYGFPNLEVVRNVKFQNPDVLFFSGDQIYEYVGGYPLIRQPVDRACLNYLRKWYLVGLAFGELMRDRPAICIPDDHDVYQGNIWGNGGNPTTMAMHDAGGYVQHPDFVNCVHKTQTSNLPDPFDPTPIKQNISVYYCDMVYGKIGFAIIADRMFKSGPRGTVATWPGRPDHLKDPKIDVKTLDKPGLNLLGDRQMKFLKHWAADWKGVDMKCVLSQTNFCNVANYHGPNREYLIADLDSGSWPQSARNAALKEMRKGFAFHLCGDQHLATIVQYGADEPGDAGYSLCVPSIANFYPRRWIPDEEKKPVKNRPAANLPNTGDYLDGLGNHIRVLAVGNPEEKYGKSRLKALHDKASGYGLLRFDRDKQTITIECWRLLADVANPKKGDQFPGWPMTIKMTDNYGKKAAHVLPKLLIKGLTDPVVQVIDQKKNEIVYTLRIKGTEFQPWVFERGTYTLKIGEPGTTKMRTLLGVNVPENPNAVLMVDFE